MRQAVGGEGRVRHLFKEGRRTQNQAEAYTFVCRWNLGGTGGVFIMICAGRPFVKAHLIQVFGWPPGLTENQPKLAADEPGACRNSQYAGHMAALKPACFAAAGARGEGGLR